jgi:exopolysaccharide biosynthesis polyprenyl glycosylphosphotransferase
MPYPSVAVLLAVTWWLVLWLSRCYEVRFVGNGTEEYKRVANASIRLVALLSVVAYGFRIDVARGFVAIMLPLGLVLLLAGRVTLRTWLYRERRQGRAHHRVVVAGRTKNVVELVRQLRQEPLAGLQVVGVCLSGGGEGMLDVDGRPVPIVGSLTSILPALRATCADALAVGSSPATTGEALRRLSYELEGTGVDLLVAPGLTSVTGTRVSIRPVAGLPLLHVDEPELSGGRQLLKGAFDRVLSLVALVLLLPLFTVIALAVKLTSRGPVLFRQERVGRDGSLFCVWKFRSMYADAEARLEQLRHLNEHDGVLFKIRDDPRVTPLGKRLRKYSLDELPQLVNVLRGQMSLVGPRPPLPSEVEKYVGHTHRRLLVKPGITGLWQVSGRSNLSWDDAVRLDLYYVENWSLGLDLSVLLKTIVIVVRGSGAY